MNQRTTTELSISSPTITSTCHNVAEGLRAMGIPASVTPNITITRNRRAEGGCRIIFGNQVSPKTVTTQVWSALKEVHQLNCAHLHIHGQFRGCIYDYLSPSNCPHSTNSNQF